MPNISEMPVPARRVLNVFYVLDVSGSMSGAPIATLNMAMGETIEALKNEAKGNADAILRISVLQFSTGCKWVTSNGPEELEGDFIWSDLEAGGLTDMGAALNELDKKLSRSEYLSSITGNYLPVIIFMTDGYATDDYSKALAKARQNRWFHRAAKIGFAIGDNPDVKMISEVVGNSEAVIKTDDLKLFARLIKFASVTSSMLQSKSRTTDEGVSGADIVKQALQSTDSNNVSTAEPNIQYDAEEPVKEETFTEFPDKDTFGDW